MKRSDLASVLFEVIQKAKDYADGGYQTEHLTADFSDLNQLDLIPSVSESDPVKESVKDSSQILRRKVIELSAGIVKCRSCPLGQNSRKVTGFGNPLSDIFIITDMISSQEENSNRPLSGEVESFFMKWMQSIQLSEDHFFMTPLVKCNTGGKSLSRESIEACRTHLDAQLDLIRPKVILALGDIVFSSLCRKFMDMETNHGKIFYYNKIPFFPIYHPRTVRIREELKRSVWNDLKNFSSWYREH